MRFVLVLPHLIRAISVLIAVAAEILTFPAMALAQEIPKGIPSGISSGIPTAPSQGVQAPRAPQGPTINPLPQSAIPGQPSYLSPGGAGGGNGGPRPNWDIPFVVAVCLNDNNYSDGCWLEGLGEAEKDLAKLFVQEYFDGVRHGLVRVYFPGAVSQYDQVQAMARIEKVAIRVVEASMKSQIAKLEAFRWDTETERENKRAEAERDAKQVADWSAAARAEANRGVNWSHDWKSSSHTVTCGHACHQLNRINIVGWTGF